MRASWSRFRRTLSSALPWTTVVLFPGCATYRGYQGPEQWAVARDSTPPTRLDRRVATAAAGQSPDASGVAVLATGEDALYARLALIEAAERSIDLQVYIWDLDASGQLVLARLLAAADRGVHVRLLLDDTATFGGERAFAAFARHPKVDVRLFNPFRTRSDGTWTGRALELLFDFRRLNRRMHNKNWIADDDFAIVGGRNVADHYFLLAEDLNFRDLDLLVAGPAARALTASFDRYWNSRWAVPIERLSPVADARLERLRGRLGRHEARQDRIPYPRDATGEQATVVLDRIAPRLTWAPVEVLTDEPEKVEHGSPSRIAERLAGAAAVVESELEVEMAYLALPETTTDALRVLVGRGVAVRVLTNSLATNDVVAAHAGYVGTRRRLLEAGVELHELRPGGHDSGRLLRPPRRSRASLHSKAVVFDRRLVYVGSLNLDPRSVVHNTENGVVVAAPAIAEEVARRFEEGCRPERSWRLRLVERPVRKSDGRTTVLRSLEWIGPTVDGREEVRTREPRASFWRRLGARLLALLPIEGQV